MQPPQGLKQIECPGILIEDLAYQRATTSLICQENNTSGWMSEIGGGIHQLDGLE